MVELDKKLDSIKKKMISVARSSPTSAGDLEELPLYSILLVLASYIAIGIGIFHFLLEFIRGPDLYLIFHVGINVVFGSGLLIAYLKLYKEKIKWSIIAVLFSLMLAAFGGIVGVLAGIIGMFGGVMSLLSTKYRIFRI